ncbi:imidazole glycerol phosphate synthase subunit HisF [Chitinispirillales bacterium ANBcel5]|uniref:imidazole glycerol phosphate synthase subunit HisF n=1 Tax=Cellulosispirillum alkaliphilum TaxID=3039283 RepID=UPI002A56F1C9|nr:imidazole glycerol phosphate synthase subunit HisF [Chitinispirillales bacterium ANBcel5]
MLSKRIISCLDVRDGKLAKSVKFLNTQDIGDPISTAKKYYEEGIDELVFYDITASSDKRNIMIDVVSNVASQIFIPFSVGGGLRTVEDCMKVRMAGAEKINLNTAAVSNPKLINQTALLLGSQAVVLSMDVLGVTKSKQIPSGYEVVTHGGRKQTGLDALWWAVEAEKLGAGELVINSIDADGTGEGYELNLTRSIADSVKIPVIASGGGGKPEHLYEVLTRGKADAALIASILHYGQSTIKELKTELSRQGLNIRTQW